MRVLESKVIHVALMLLVVIVPLALILDFMTLYIIVGSLLIATSAAAAHAYWPTARMSLGVNARNLKAVDIMSIAIVLFFASTALRESYITVYRELVPLKAGRSAEYFAPLIFFRYFILVAAIMVLHSRKSYLGPRFMQKVPGWPRVILAIISGLTLALVILALRVAL